MFSLRISSYVHDALSVDGAPFAGLGIRLHKCSYVAPRCIIHLNSMSEPAHRPSHNHRVFLVLLTAFLISGFGITSGAADTSKMDSFAKCLADQKTTMYGSFLCPHCDDQKKLFDGAFKYVPYVECTIPQKATHLRLPNGANSIHAHLDFS